MYKHWTGFVRYLIPKCQELSFFLLSVCADTFVSFAHMRVL